MKTRDHSMSYFSLRISAVSGINSMETGVTCTITGVSEFRFEDEWQEPFTCFIQPLFQYCTNIIFHQSTVCVPWVPHDLGVVILISYSWDTGTHFLVIFQFHSFCLMLELYFTYLQCFLLAICSSAVIHKIHSYLINT